MAPKEPFKVRSLKQHIEDTKKGLSAEAQYNRRPAQRSSAAVKKEPADIQSSIFGNNDDDSESSDSSDDSSDDESGADLLTKVIATAGKTAIGSKRRSRDEEIADSDVERNAVAKNPAAKKREEPVKNEESSESGSESEDSSSESESEDEKPKAKTNGVAAKAVAAKKEVSSSSSEEESSSEEDSEEESSDEETEKKPAATKPAIAPTTNGHAKATESSSSSDESEEEESSEDEAPAKPAQPAQKKTQPAKEDSSSESEDSEDEEDDQVDESMHLSDRESNKQMAVPNFIAPDFMLRKGNDGANGQDVAQILNEANLQGKQFWYFTVPSNVPISVVENLEIPMDRAQLGDRIFSHDGQDFGVSFDTMTPKSSIQILIPSGNNSKYQTARHAIDQTMHVKRITQLGGAAASTTGPAPSRPARAQPKGLKARYQPFGVSTPMGTIGEAGSSDDADVEMGDAPVSAETPAKSKGRKQKKDGNAQSTATSEKSKGKRKHSASEEDAAAAEEQLREENQSAAKKSKKQKTDRVGSPDLGSEPPFEAKKQTPIVPPTIPQPSYSFSNIGSTPVASTPPPKSASIVTNSAIKKSAKKVRLETPVPSSSQTLPGTGKKETPIPIPRLTAVPLPIIPGSSSKPKESPVPIPAPPVTPSQTKTKKVKKQKGDERGDSPISHQEPPPSAQPTEKKAKKTKTKQG